MFTACTAAGGRAIAEGLAPCLQDGKAYHLDSLVYDAARINAKLQAFDTWLWADCEGSDQVEPTLQVDCIEASRRPHALNAEDPPLFRGRPPSIEKNTDYMAEIGARHPNAPPVMSSLAIPSMTLEDAKPMPLSLRPHEVTEPEVYSIARRPLMREVPDELEKDELLKDDSMNARAREMKEQMNRRSKEMRNEWTKGSKQLQAWLASNSFFSVNAKRKGLLSFTYPLHVAAAKNDAQIIQLMLLHEADPNQLDSSGRTPLQVAAKKCKNGSHRAAVAQLTAVS